MINAKNTQISVASVDNPRIEAFLIELTELSRKHGVEIGGSGDCGSPWAEECEDAAERGYITVRHRNHEYSYLSFMKVGDHD